MGILAIVCKVIWILWVLKSTKCRDVQDFFILQPLNRAQCGSCAHLFTVSGVFLTFLSCTVSLVGKVLWYYVGIVLKKLFCLHCQRKLEVQLRALQSSVHWCCELQSVCSILSIQCFTLFTCFQCFNLSTVLRAK